MEKGSRIGQFSSLFQLRFLETIKAEAMAPVEEFWRGNFDIERLNKSFLVLTAKCKGAVSEGEFWHISLSISIYLLIAKVWANRLREVIGWPVRPFLSAIIPGRQLVDGAVVVGEILAVWKRKATMMFM